MIEIQTSFLTMPFKEAVPVRGRLIKENRFLKVRILESNFYLSVLPGFHDASLEEIDFKIKYFFSNYHLNFDKIDFSTKFFNLVPIDNYLKCIQNETLFNIEILLLGILKNLYPHLFNIHQVLENELYRPNLGPLNYIHSKCLKIKINPTSIEELSLLIRQLHSQNSELIVRLDGNRKFELNDLVVFTQQLEKNISAKSFSKIDYIEEPFKNFSDTFLFNKRSKLKISMDESFSSYINFPEKEFPEDMPVVIKPSLFGISTIHKWIQSHAENRIIISSAFEHPTVKIWLVFLASLRSSEFHGLEDFILNNP